MLGITRVAGAFASGVSGGMRVLSLIIGILAIILAIYVINNPAAGALMLSFFLGVGLLLIGIESLSVGGTHAQGAGQETSIALGVIAIILGFIVLFRPTRIRDDCTSTSCGLNRARHRGNCIRRTRRTDRNKSIVIQCSNQLHCSNLAEYKKCTTS